MKTKIDRSEARNIRGRWSRTVATYLCLTLSLGGLSSLAQTTNSGTVLAWNNLGMHCMDADFSVFCILPPYNVVNAQAISAAGLLVGGANGVTLSYTGVADATGSLNTTSAGKANFWQYVQALFGIALPQDVGLPVPGPNSYAMPGVNNTPQNMEFAATLNWYAAYGVPITPIDDAGRTNRYPMMRVTAKSGGTTLDATDIVLPVSTEMDCRSCHGSTAGPAAQPANGWVNLPDQERDFRLNVLRKHDDRQLGTPVFATALTAAGYNPAGLYATVVVDKKAILCAACHHSEALPGSGQAGIPPLTESMHAMHGSVSDPATGMLLDSEMNRTSCYYCHPGQATRCLRGVMGSSIAADGSLAMECQSCHGGMSAVGAATRTGWLMEPNCQACHSGDAVNNAGQIRYTSVFSSPTVMRVAANQTFATTPNAPAAGYSLYRFSTGHGGLYCQACHGSTHAEFPSIDANDNVTSIQHQGHVGVLAECDACHTTVPSTINGGPHGLHPLGQTWVSRHQDNASAQCQTCHGKDSRGTVLSRVRGDRTLSALGTKTLWRGFQVGCYLCHNGPGGSGTGPAAAAVTSGATSTPVGMAVTIPLTATDPAGAALTLRVVSQALHGRVALSGKTATYYPDPNFSGGDVFTFAAWNGTTDSNLGSYTITVGSGSGGGGGGGTGGGTGACTYAISPLNATLGTAAGSASITVTTAAGCPWTATSSASWLTIASGTGRTGPGTVTYSFTANTAAASRAATITIAGLSFTVNQAGTSGGGAGGNAAAGQTLFSSTCARCHTPTAIAPFANRIVTNLGSINSQMNSITLTAQQVTDLQAYLATVSGGGGGTCTYAISPLNATVGAAAGSASLSVTTTAGCTWQATANTAWLTISSATNGTGSGTVTYSYAANNTASARSGTLTVAGLPFTVTQTGTSCSYALMPTSATVGAIVGTGAVTVNTGAGCAWNAGSNVPWLTITGGASGTGPGTVAYTIAANTSTAARSGTLSIAGLTFTVTQAGAAPGACTYTLAPTAVSVGMAATNGSVTVNTTPTCRWTASSAASWISITSGASGTGSGTVRFSVAANTTAVTRNGALTIAGLNFVVTQAGNAVCTYDLTPTSIRFSAGSGSSSFRVTTGGSCRWTARPSVSWITITGGANGTGNGRVQFQVSRNQNSRQRTGTITVADQTFTVYQSAGSSGGESGSTFGTIQVAEAAGRQRLTVELVVRNADQKPESAKQPAVYLSNDAKVDKADTLLWTRAVPELAPGEDATHKFRVTLPAGVSTHGKYLVAIPDTRLALIGEAKPIAVYGPLQ